MSEKTQAQVIVSISGHRDCCYPEKIKTQLETRFSEIKEGFLKKHKVDSVKPDINPSGVRWIFLSPLAVGADQICAEVALKCGFELIVPLPMPLDLYEEDFSKDELRNFKNLKPRFCS